MATGASGWSPRGKPAVVESRAGRSNPNIASGLVVASRLADAAAGAAANFRFNASGLVVASRLADAAAGAAANFRFNLPVVGGGSVPGRRDRCRRPPPASRSEVLGLGALSTRFLGAGSTTQSQGRVS
jgi:hypothetical protein